MKIEIEEKGLEILLKILEKAMNATFHAFELVLLSSIAKVEPPREPLNKS